MRKRCRKPCQGKIPSMGLSSILALILNPWSLRQSCIAALSPPAQVFCQSLAPSSCSELPQYYSPAWQLQGWVSSWSPSSAHLLHELRPIGYSLCPGLFLCHPWLPSPFRAVCSCFQDAFSLNISCNHCKKTKKKKSHPYLHPPGYSLHYTKAYLAYCL